MSARGLFVPSADKGPLRASPSDRGGSATFFRKWQTPLPRINPGENRALALRLEGGLPVGRTPPGGAATRTLGRQRTRSASAGDGQRHAVIPQERGRCVPAAAGDSMPACHLQGAGGRLLSGPHSLLFPVTGQGEAGSLPACHALRGPVLGLPMRAADCQTRRRASACACCDRAFLVNRRDRRSKRPFGNSDRPRQRFASPFPPMRYSLRAWS